VILAARQHAATDVLDIAYEEGGPPEAPVVLLLHGWPDDVRGWRGVAPQLHAAGFRRVASYPLGRGIRVMTRRQARSSPSLGNP
jgi:pimeloyl-ACP methyl ester carboxylesterase